MAKELRVKVKWDDKEVKAGTSRNKKDIKGIGTEASKTNEVMSKLGATMVGVFGVGLITKTVSSMVALNKELFQTGQAALGIQKAFKAVDGSSLDDLRQATKGTISDFKLMQSSVKGTKLGIDIAKMPALLNFARQSAKDMGEDVEVLAEKISIAIGRKSMMILDDFGITAMQLKKELGGLSAESASVAQLTDAVLKIAEKTMSTTGAGAADAADAYNQLVSTMENAKLEGGLLLLNNKEVKEVLENIAKTINTNKGSILQFITEWGTGALKIADNMAKVAGFIADAFTDQQKTQHALAQEKLVSIKEEIEMHEAGIKEVERMYRWGNKKKTDRHQKHIDRLKIEFDEQYKRVLYLSKVDTLAAEQKKKKDDEELERIKKINEEKKKGALLAVGKEPTSDAMTTSELAGVSPYLAEKQDRDNAIADITNKQKTLLEQKEADRVAVLSAMYSNIETERQLAQEKAIAESKLRDFEKQKIKEQRDQTIKLATSAINSVTAIVGIMANESLNAFGKFSSVIGQGGSILSEIPGYELVGSLVTAGAGLATSLFGQSDSDNDSSTTSSALANRPLSNIQKEGSKTINNYFSVGFNSTYMGSSQNDLREFAGIVSDEINDLALSAG